MQTPLTCKRVPQDVYTYHAYAWNSFNLIESNSGAFVPRPSVYCKSTTSRTYMETINRPIFETSQTGP